MLTLLSLVWAARVAPPEADLDGDGLTWREECWCGSDPLRADADGDGLSDFAECAVGFDPNQADSDGDAVSDFFEIDCLEEYVGATEDDRDADGVGDALEGSADTDGDGLLDFCDQDADGDGRTDAEEGEGDDDCDGVTNRLDADDPDDVGADSGAVDSGDERTSEGCSSTRSSGSRLSALLGLLFGIGRRLTRRVSREVAFIASFAALLLVPPAAFAGALTWPADDQWVPLARGGEPIVDAVGDVDASHSGGALDIVGSEELPAFLWYADSEAYYFRIRVGGDPASLRPTWRGAWGVLLSMDGASEKIDYSALVAFSSPDTPVLLVFHNRTVAAPGSDGVELLVSRDATDSDYRFTEASESTGSSPDWVFDLRFALDTATVLETTSIIHVIAATDDVGAAALDLDISSCATMSAVADSLSDPISIDQDADGLTWFEERECHSDPAEADIDGDGLSDLEECGTEFNPYWVDSDFDGISDADEYPCRGRYVAASASDRDNDGIPDAVEGCADTDGDGLLDFCDQDADGDGRLDAAEGDGDDDCDGIIDRLDPDDADGRCDTGDSGGPSGDSSDRGFEAVPVRCGCASGPGVGLAWLPLVALLAARRRKSGLPLPPCHGISKA